MIVDEGSCWHGAPFYFQFLRFPFNVTKLHLPFPSFFLTFFPSWTVKDFLKYKFIYFNGRLITLQCCIGLAIHQHESAKLLKIFFKKLLHFLLPLYKLCVDFFKDLFYIRHYCSIQECNSGGRDNISIELWESRVMQASSRNKVDRC